MEPKNSPACFSQYQSLSPPYAGFCRHLSHLGAPPLAGNTRVTMCCWHLVVALAHQEVPVARKCVRGRAPARHRARGWRGLPLGEAAPPRRLVHGRVVWYCTVSVSLSCSWVSSTVTAQGHPSAALPPPRLWGKPPWSPCRNGCFLEAMLFPLRLEYVFRTVVGGGSGGRLW